GFANRALWPLLHFRLDLVDYDRATREGSRRVNAMFADRLAPMLRDDDTVWVHDYHLIPLGALLRERGVGCRIGFYLHVPVPSADLMMAVPDHQRLFSPLYAYDLLGFQTQRDNDRFHSYVRLYGGGRIVGPGLLEAAGGRRFRPGAFPISIDPPEIAAPAAGDRRRPAGLLQGPARALPRLRTLPAAAPGPEGHPDLPADRAAVARRRQRIPHPAQPAGADRRAHQRRPCRAKLDPAALRQPQLPACHPHRLLPHRTGWPGHPAARRHEPGGQGIRGLAGSRESRRAGAVPAGRRGAGAEGGAAGEPARPRRRGRRHRHRRDHAAGAAQGALERDDGAPAEARHPCLAQGVPGRPGIRLTGWRQLSPASWQVRACGLRATRVYILTVRGPPPCAMQAP